MARDTLRRVLIHDQADRDAISSQLLRYRDERGNDLADIIDMLTLEPLIKNGRDLDSTYEMLLGMDLELERLSELNEPR
jgi:hypothetical protein